MLFCVKKIIYQVQNAGWPGPDSLPGPEIQIS